MRTVAEEIAGYTHTRVSGSIVREHCEPHPGDIWSS
jgi:hypothetical protein